MTKCFAGGHALRQVSLTLGKGMNFIIGASGSGKTTLLRILSGMEDSFEGEASYCGKSLKGLSAKEKSALWGGEFGFVWQDFHLLDDRTVLENVLLPQYLREGADEEKAMRLLRELKISELAQQKAGKLSGGQKQRTAIARELMKNPQVIFADEPTSALDAASAQVILGILRTLSKKRTVVVVTHDTSLIDAKSRVYELDKGELVSAPPEPERTPAAPSPKEPGRLSFRGALSLGRTSVKRRWGRAAVTAFCLLAAAALLLVSVSGSISGGGKAAFDQLLASYGESLLDISLASSFVSAGGTDGQEQDGPQADVTQNLDGLFERYREDPRVSHVLFSQAFDGIEVSVDGQACTVETSNNVPVMNRLLAGSMPMGKGNEAAVPESFVQRLGLTNEQAIGKEMNFRASLYNWESGQPVKVPVEVTAKIVGVVDTDMAVEYEGEITKIPIDDSFFFSPNALGEMRRNAGMKAEPGSFYIRAKTPRDLISLKDELNASGIVPLGRFELVEDIVRLNEQTEEQSSSAVIVIAALAVLAVLAVSLLNAALRRHEFAVFRVSGYSGGQLSCVLLAESLLLGAAAAVLFLAASPLLDLAAGSLWNVSLLSGGLLLPGVLLTLALSVLSWAAASLFAVRSKTEHSLRTGDR